MNTPPLQLVCINKEGWFILDTHKPSVGPKYNEIVTFVKTSDTSPEFIVLAEYRFDKDGEDNEYIASGFVPLISDKVLQKELNEIFEKIKS